MASWIIGEFEVRRGIVDRNACILRQQHHGEGDGGEREARVIAKACVARRSEISGSAVVAEIMDATKITMSRAGSARNPTSISRRAPRVPNAVPMSMAASEMKNRAAASSPTSAIASATEVNGRRVPMEGMIAAAVTINPKTM